MREAYQTECNTIEDNCTYTAEAHHSIAARSQKQAFWFQVIPAVVAALSGLLVVGKVIPLWWGWLTAISAIVSAVGAVLDPNKTYYAHLNAAKDFTVIKNRARALGAVFSSDMSDQEFAREAKALHDQYNELVRYTPPTTQAAFEHARKRIKDGVHDPD